MTEYLPQVITLAKTATGDTAFKLALTDLWLSYADVFVYTNHAYMGDKRAQEVAVYANDIYEFPKPVNINDIFFKNYTAASNTVIVIIGSILSKKEALEYGISLPP